MARKTVRRFIAFVYCALSYAVLVATEHGVFSVAIPCTAAVVAITVVHYIRLCVKGA